jgi:hypothetical protein
MQTSSRSATKLVQKKREISLSRLIPCSYIGLAYLEFTNSFNSSYFLREFDRLMSISSKHSNSLFYPHKPLPRPIIQRLMPKIHIIKLSIMSSLAHQSMMTTLLDNLATIDNDDAVRMSNGVEAMSN